MIEKLFNENWSVSVTNTDLFMPNAEPEALITLPHDAMISTEREARASGRKGFFKNGAWNYKKTFFVPEENQEKKTILKFEGVYQRAMVYINGDFAGQHQYGYTPFLIDADRFLKYGEENDISVILRTADDSRWYTGAGVYRDVYLMTSSLVYIKPYGVKITTPEVDNERAVVAIALDLKNESAASKMTVLSEIKLKDSNGDVVATSKAPCTVYRGEEAVVRHRLYIKHPVLWDIEKPHLYTCHVRLIGEKQEVLEEGVERFGVRTLSLDPDKGLRINQKQVKLRGACIHHDNGPLGAITTHDVERRRIKKMKEAGFNAIRMSHHPASRALLDVCDELGMLVMDEAFDMWTISKSDFDYSLDFATWWEKDIEAMVNQCFNHPSVIMYSIGNEIKEVGSVNGSSWGRKLAEKIRTMDATRYITNGVNGMLAIMDFMMKKMAEASGGQASMAPSGEINNMMTGLGDKMKQVMTSEFVTSMTEESFAYLDIAGYNYMDTRYEMDKELFPNRIVVGSETYACDIDKNWKTITENGNLIGDFCWTGWDYLGEAGIGKVKYPEVLSLENVYNSYPTMTAMAGDFDITGFRRPVSYYREIVFGMRTKPYMAVQRPENYGNTPYISPWSWSDSVSHWSWTGFEGKPIKVEVYTHGDEVELFLNGSSIGRQEAGASNRYKAIFDTIYEAGELTAIAYKDGVELGRFSLNSVSDKFELVAKAEQSEISVTEYAFIDISFQDKEGNVAGVNRLVEVKVNGVAELAGVANGDPDTTESFAGTTITTFDGRALAVIQGTDTGNAEILISSEGMESKVIKINCVIR